MAGAVKPTALMQDATEALSQQARRIEIELQFARELLADNPRQDLATALEAAEKLAGEVFRLADASRIAKGVADIESRLGPFGKLAKTHTLYAVAHAHIDMNWMWGWPETVAICNDTFATMLKLMEEFPTFHFSQSQASVYRIVEQYNPELLGRIRQRVKEGRWEVTASHWVEGDRNMVSGESLTRHLLYTRKYLQQIFGLSPEDIEIDWSPDTFGHPLSVPMYLTRGGVKYVYLHRPGGVGPKRPEAFWWKSPDGSRVLVRNDMARGYNCNFGQDLLGVLSAFRKDAGLPFSMFVYGVGDHGGGPTRRDLARAIDMNAWPIFPNIKLATAREFYARLAEEGGKLPTLDCELNMELAGCYTTQSLIKRSNRIAEHRLLDAEAACTIAQAAAGRPYPAAQLEEAWRDTLFCHFHDILPGSNVHDSRTWMHGLFQKTIATTSIAETQALRALAEQINTAVPGLQVSPPPASSSRATLGAGVGWGSPQHMMDQADNSGGGTRALMVFNPTAVARREVIEATIWADATWMVTDEIRNRSFCVRTPDGQIIEAQKTEVGQYWGHIFVRLAFPVDVPSLGYATYTIMEDACDAAAKVATQITPPHHCGYLIQERRPEGLINDLLQLEIDPLTGGIRKLEDRRTGKSLVGSSPWRLEYALEKPHGMTAWIIDNAVEYGEPHVLAIDRKLDGPHKATVDVKLRIKESELTLTYELRAGDPRLYIHLTGTWFQRGTPQTGIPTLRFKMPLGLSNIATRYEIPFATIDRDLAHGEEVPSLNVAQVTGSHNGVPAGLLLLNDCKHGHSLDADVFRLTLIRSGYDPDPLPDVGQHEIHLAIVPFAGDMAPAAAIAEGKRFNRPVRLVTAALHAGKLPAVASAAAVTPQEVVLTEIKAAEDGQGLIVRVVNPGSEARKASIAIDAALLGRFTKAVEVDLLERPAAANSASIAGNKLSVTVPANALASVRLIP